MKPTLDEVIEASEIGAGYCLNCKQWTTDHGAEPDAEKYPCPECGENQVIGSDNVFHMFIE